MHAKTILGQLTPQQLSQLTPQKLCQMTCTIHLHQNSQRLSSFASKFICFKVHLRQSSSVSIDMPKMSGVKIHCVEVHQRQNSLHQKSFKCKFVKT